MKALRILLLVAGLALIGLSVVFLFSLDRDNETIATSNNGMLICKPDDSIGRAEENQSKCEVQHLFVRPGQAAQSYAEIMVMGIVGLGLIGTSVALGQFRRPGDAAPRHGGPGQPPMPAQHGGPAPQYNPGAPMTPPGPHYQ
ncbi:MAG TPA: hypothetical protein VLH10_28250 [Yinghuangia sp.]|uniref:hypothetical protein n=1 Tax=Yinghuangia sp. YIM S10712 TaxID=3436930 RepID=UPI002C6A2B2E|nr:hypothetical protein [Yinghuangia sp.]